MRLARTLSWATLLLASTAQAGARFAIAGGDGAEACVALAGAEAGDATGVTIAIPDEEGTSVATRRASIGARLDAPCSALAEADVDGPFHALVFPDQTPPDGWFGVAKLDDTPATIRACTSMEGLHLTAWAGEPLHGRRLWHAYVYLGYDVEPSCTEADVREDEGPR